MAEYLTNNIDLKSVADAIRAKTGETDSIAYPEGYVSKIEGLTATSDGNIIPAVVLEGGVGYSKGEKVVGAMPNYTGQSAPGYESKTLLPADFKVIPTRKEPPIGTSIPDCPRVTFYTTYDDQDIYINSSSQLLRKYTAIYPGNTTVNGVYVEIPKSKYVEMFGNATADDVAKGKTYLGADGPSIGTLEVLDTSDANATVKDIVSGQTAYANGAKITGTMKEITNLVNSSQIEESDGLIRIPVKTSGLGPGEKGYMEAGESIATVATEPSSFGSATASDVIKGKTFTSKAGYLVNGTYEPIDTSDATATSMTILEGTTAYVNGEKITGEMVYLGNQSFDVNSLISERNPDGWENYSTPPDYWYFEGTAYPALVAQISGLGAVDPGTTLFEPKIYIPKAQYSTIFGDSASADVVSGKTFMGANGAGTGTMPLLTSLNVVTSSLTVDPLETYLLVPVHSSTKGYLQDKDPNTEADYKINTKIPLNLFGEATSNEVLKGKTFTSVFGYNVKGTYEPPEAAKETWVLNDNYIIPNELLSFAVLFQSNGQSFTGITVNLNTRLGLLYNNVMVSDPIGAIQDVYRKIVLDNSASGDLLTWLQLNGTKQGCRLSYSAY